MNQAPERLSEASRHQIENLNNILYLSAASAWEIGIKSQLQKLDLPEAPEIYVPKRMASNNVLSLPITHEHALLAAALPEHHKDPFDRILIAQALIEDLVLMTADKQLRRYSAPVIWAI
jgi:PIN domain nuclease of toxin-antitoxin system